MYIDLLIIRIKKAICILRSPRLTLAFLRYGVFAGAEHRPVLSHEFKTIVDIGANEGQFALACREWAPNARIISFEPLQSPANKFKALFNSDDRIVLNQVAIGPKNQCSLIHVSAREDSSSLLPIGLKQVEHFPGTEERGAIEINVATLGSCLSPQDIDFPAMLKLDVQGFEMQALEGCLSLLPLFDCIYCECSFVELYSGQSLAWEVVKWLHDQKFELAGIYNVSCDKKGNSLQADFLFKKSKTK